MGVSSKTSDFGLLIVDSVMAKVSPYLFDHYSGSSSSDTFEKRIGVCAISVPASQ